MATTKLLLATLRKRGSRNLRSVLDPSQPFVGCPSGKCTASLVLFVAGGLLVSFTAFLVLHRWEMRSETEAIASQFRLDAHERFRAIQRETEKYLQALWGLGALYDASERVTRREFHVFASKLLEANPSIQALEWIPRVPASERIRYERQARESIPEFRVTEWREDGVLAPVSHRETYYPVYFVEPYWGNEAAPGFDLASESVRREALERARDSGQAAASGPISLVQEPGEQYALLAYLPIYQKDVQLMNVAQRRQHLEGFVVSVCRLGDLVDYAIAGLAHRGIDLWLFDTTLASEPKLLHVWAALATGTSPHLKPSQPSTAGLRVERTLDVGGRRWRVIAAPAPDSIVPPVAYTAWLVLLIGLLMTGLLAGHLRSMQRYGGRLVQANRALDREVTERRRTEATLRESEERFRQIVESAVDAILICDDAGRIRIANSQAERLFGYPPQALTGELVERLVPEALRKRHTAHRQSYFAEPKPRPTGRRQELVCQRRDGALMPVEISLSPMHRAQGPLVTVIIRDITERKEAEAKLRRLNRTYGVLSRCNSSLSRAFDEQALLNAFCRNVVEVGGYRFAWVGYARHDRARSVCRVARAGHTDARLSVAAVTWSDAEGMLNASGMAIHTGEPVILRDIERESRFAPWQRTCLQQGYRSMIALPLKTRGPVWGSFSIFSTRCDAFHEEEAALLGELAENLAFGIEVSRARTAQKQKVRLLREEAENEERKRIAATLHDGIGQSAQAVNLGLKTLRAVATQNGPPWADLLDRIIDETGGIIKGLRDITHELRPPILERMGLPEAIKYHCHEVARQAGVAIEVACNGGACPYDDRVKTQCFLGFREALSNAVTHARATRIRVSLKTLVPGSLTVRITDDGVGFILRSARRSPSGLGLSMITERAQSVGGYAEIHSAPGEGTMVSITVPLGLGPSSRARRQVSGGN